MNVLPLIRDWLAERGCLSDQGMLNAYIGLDRPLFNLRPGREVLQEWLKSKGVTELELAADAMIAAGIGRSEEQGCTVYCRVTY